ncbi:hypothetical protein K431DRAFT_294072 [Polychaeton citri CBS 116435]|uniref:HTH CENPB-type domain-containing protein n=1 Tax=Polychaeton citri CBS 116435 TaxID=1314669 RepID=A0A9P4Q9J9_9PEZI|nr:hypothetical protein K431DRAFT_294072 [Polychaeton citri CBS 116435]
MGDGDHSIHFPTEVSMPWNHNPHAYPAYPHSHHGTPAQEHSSFSFSSPSLPMDPNAFGNAAHHRPIQPQLQPVSPMHALPRWPSEIGQQSHGGFQPMFATAVQPMQPMPFGSLPTPAPATPGRSASTPRRTLTDHDRKRMCLYAEDHPDQKQTDIGRVFGVERRFVGLSDSFLPPLLPPQLTWSNSTVSKVLRQKEKYLYQDDGSRSPIKRAKGRSPDIERALAVWAKNQERKGAPLTDDMIREKAHAFSATTTSPDNQQTLSTAWIEKFKLKHNLMGARGRKGSLAPEDAEILSATTASSVHSPSGTSPVSPGLPEVTSPAGELHSSLSRDSLKHESPDSYAAEFPGRYGPSHSQSTTSLHSAFTDTAPSSFSPGPISPTTISPFFTPDSGTAPSPFIPSLGTQHGLAILPSSNSHRGRSHTFPLLDQYMASQVSADETTPKYTTTLAVLDSPMEEAPDPLVPIHEVLGRDRRTSTSQNHTPAQEDYRPRTVTPSETMGPPPLPASVTGRKRKEEGLGLSTSPPPTAQLTNSRRLSTQAHVTVEDARKAFEVVLAFCEQQPSGFLEFQETVSFGRIKEKLNITTTQGS